MSNTSLNPQYFSEEDNIHNSFLIHIPKLPFYYSTKNKTSIITPLRKNRDLP